MKRIYTDFHVYIYTYLGSLGLNQQLSHIQNTDR